MVLENEGKGTPTVTVYTSSLCPVCDMVKRFLETFEIPYEEVMIDLNPIARLKLIATTKKLTIPQTNVNGEWISGFDPETMLKILMK